MAKIIVWTLQELRRDLLCPIEVYISTITDGVCFLVTLSLSELCIQVMCSVNVDIVIYGLKTV